jgi:hypothetical protein
MASTYVSICIFASTAGVVKDKAGTYRRAFYRYMERYAWLTDIGWIMDRRTCEEYLPKLQEIADNFRRETGRQLFAYYITSLPLETLKQLIESPYSKAPQDPNVAERLRKLVEIYRKLVEISV